MGVQTWAHVVGCSKSNQNYGSWCRKCAAANLREGSIEEAQQLGELSGNKCISTEYVKANGRSKFECSDGHLWSTCLTKLRQANPSCPHCAKVKEVADGIAYKKCTIEEMQLLAESKDGKCLSTDYINLWTKLHWQCDKGHQWWAIPSEVKHAGSWCPDCATTKKGTIEEMRTLATSKGGKCLSQRYTNSSTKLHWQCNQGHTCQASSSSIKNGEHWCPECVGLKKGTIEQMKELAKSKGGKCLSRVYINSVTELQGKCDKSHVWRAVPKSVRNGSWCPVCAGKKKATIEEIVTCRIPRRQMLIGDLCKSIHKVGMGM